MLKLPLKIHGGKDHLASKIIALFPKRYLTFCEPFFGAGNIMLRLSPEGHSEIANDVNKQLTGFWHCLQEEGSFLHLKETLEKIPFSSVEFKDAFDQGRYNTIDGDHVEAIAANMFVVCRMSLSARGKGFTAVSSSRVRRGMNEQVSAWLTAIDGLADVHARLKRILILNEDFERCIKKVDHKKTLFYCDPPYLHETRVTTNEYGPYEMDREAHKRLLIALDSIQGKFVLSGYHSSLYDDFAKRNKWRCVEFSVKNSAAGGKVKRTMTECCWMNY